jgi:hypothetical protein
MFMNSIKVNKADLLKKLHENRDAHKLTFTEAMEGYKEKVQAWLEERLAAAKKGRVPDMLFNLPHPIDQTKDYNRAIAMLEMSVDDVIELEEHDFQCYVQDEWSWSRTTTMTNTMYMKAK